MSTTKLHNPIPKSTFFATPKDFNELIAILQSCGTAEEQRMAWYGAQLALNLSHKLIEEQS